MCPDDAHALLDADHVLPSCRTVTFGKQEYIFAKTTASTNEDARRMGQSGAPHGSVVVADMQTHGRGRQERPWVSPAGCGIYVSLLLRPDWSPEHTPLLTLAAAVALVEAIDRTAHCNATIKWPNDVLLNGRKMAGILTEASLEAGRVDFVVVGCGINVNTSLEALPERSQFPATSLAVETGRSFYRAALLSAWLEHYEDCFQGLVNGEHESILERWMQRSVMKGKLVMVKNAPHECRGLVTGIAPDGALLVLSESSQREERILSGDVLFCE